MNWISSTRTFPLALALLAAASLPAMAALGGDASSVEKDVVHLKAAIRSTQKTNYAVHELTAPGSTVREYVTPTGKVFAVAWNGPVMPDLQQILGTYYTHFTTAAKNQRARGVRGPVSVNEPGVVIQSGGHMAAFRGKAYIPEMLPEGVHADAIQ